MPAAARVNIAMQRRSGLDGREVTSRCSSSCGSAGSLRSVHRDPVALSPSCSDDAPPRQSDVRALALSPSFSVVGWRAISRIALPRRIIPSFWDGYQMLHLPTFGEIWAEK